MKYKVDPNTFATVLTSCGRFDLLGETVSSLLRHFDIDRIIIAEDSEDNQGAADFARAFPVADVRLNLPKLGQMRSIDAHYATLSAPYVLHLEDDWGFTRSLDLDRVTALLEARPDISVVCIAHRVYDQKFEKGARRESHDGIDYLVWDTDAHPKWFSVFVQSLDRAAVAVARDRTVRQIRDRGKPQPVLEAARHAYRHGGARHRRSHRR